MALSRSTGAPLAARAEGRTLALDEIAAACRARLDACPDGLVLIEGAGGVMSPLTGTEACLDLVAALGLPALFVAGAYLGAVSHALTGLEALRARGVAIAAMVVSEGEVSIGAHRTEEAIRAIEPDLAIVSAARAGGDAWAGRLARLVMGQH